MFGKKRDSKVITLGSGYIYAKIFTGEVPETEALETTENQLGYIKNGAAIDYKPTFVTESDDFGYVFKKILTEEEATLKAGIMTWNGKTLNQLCSTARVTDDVATGKRTVKIGGIGNQNGDRYVIRFAHKDKVDGDVRITIVGNNEAGFNIEFAKDKATVIDAEFKAMPMDAEGTLILYEEQIGKEEAPAA